MHRVNCSIQFQVIVRATGWLRSICYPCLHWRRAISLLLWRRPIIIGPTALLVGPRCGRRLGVIGRVILRLLCCGAAVHLRRLGRGRGHWHHAQHHLGLQQGMQKHVQTFARPFVSWAAMQQTGALWASTSEWLSAQDCTTAAACRVSSAPAVPYLEQRLGELRAGDQDLAGLRGVLLDEALHLRQNLVQLRLGHARQRGGDAIWRGSCSRKDRV